MVKAVIDNDLFVAKNLEKLVKRYAHQRIAICNGEIFTGINAVKKARQKYPKLVPLSLPVPGKEEFFHIL